MLDTRRSVLALVGTISIGSFAWSTAAHAKIQIPIDPPIARPLPAEMSQIEQSITTALSDLSEDQPRTVQEIIASSSNLQHASKDNVDLAMMDLLWANKIEEVDDGKFRLHRSHAG